MTKHIFYTPEERHLIFRKNNANFKVELKFLDKSGNEVKKTIEDNQKIDLYKPTGFGIIVGDPLITKEGCMHWSSKMFFSGGTALDSKHAISYIKIGENSLLIKYYINNLYPDEFFEIKELKSLEISLELQLEKEEIEKFFLVLENDFNDNTYPRRRCSQCNSILFDIIDRSPDSISRQTLPSSCIACSKYALDHYSHYAKKLGNSQLITDEFSNPEKAILEDLEFGIVISKNIEEELLENKYKYLKGTLLVRTAEKRSEGVETLESVLKWAEKHRENDANLYSDVVFMLADGFLRVPNLEMALKYAKISYEIDKEEKNEENQAKSGLILGNILKELKNYNQAEIYAEESLHFRIKHNLSQYGIQMTVRLLTSLYIEQNKKDKIEILKNRVKKLVGGEILLKLVIGLENPTEIKQKISPWALKAQLAGMKGDSELELRSYLKAVEEQPEHSTIWLNLGTCLKKMGKLNEAYSCYEKGLKYDDKDELLWLNKGDVLQQVSRYKEAMECFEKVIEIDPDIDDAWVGIGVIHLNLKKFEESLKNLDKALKINPNNPLAKKIRKEVIDHILKKKY